MRAGISAIGICRAPSSRQTSSSLASRTSRTVCFFPALRMSASSRTEITSDPLRGSVDIARMIQTYTTVLGVVTRRLARIRLSDKMAHDDLVCPPSVSACDHPARRLAVYAFHAQLSRRRRSACGARSGYLLRNGATMGFEVRAVVRPRTSPSTPAANICVGISMRWP